MNNNNFEHNNSILAIKDDTFDESVVGSIVYWGGLAPTRLADLAREWDARGLPMGLLPAAPTPAKALGVAMRELAEKRVLVRPLENRGVFGLTIEHVRENADPIYEPIMRAAASKTKGLTIEVKQGHEYLVERLRVAYDEAAHFVTVVDMGGFLTDVAKKLDATSLRPSGGIYFVPRQSTDTLLRAIDAIHAACINTRVFRIPAMNAQDALDAISAAIREEADSEIRAIENDIVEFYDSGETSLGKRALQTRLSRLNSLRGKIAGYEELLSVRLTEFTGRMELLSANVSRAVAAIESDSDN